MRVMAVDPGRAKCGVAVCGPEGVLARSVVEIGDLRALASGWMAAYRVDAVIVGSQTGSKQVLDILRNLTVPVKAVPERGSTLRARRRYFLDHPRRGWRRLVPLSLQVPPEPYDDYAAALLAEAYLQALESAAGAPA